MRHYPVHGDRKVVSYEREDGGYEFLDVLIVTTFPGYLFGPAGKVTHTEVVGSFACTADRFPLLDERAARGEDYARLRLRGAAV